MKKIVYASFLAVCFLAVSNGIAQNAAIGAPQQQADKPKQPTPAPAKAPAATKVVKQEGVSSPAGRAVKQDGTSPAPATPASNSDAKSGEAPAGRAVKQEGVSNSPAVAPTNVNPK
ncbi:MAG: hypothetical protein HYU69_00190 [Bacteroidetes bacterium]|nr:hypothetical protein [Bacteroidota bacterium]